MIKLNAEILFKSVLFQRAKWLSYAFIHSQVYVSSDEACFIEL